MSLTPHLPFFGGEMQGFSGKIRRTLFIFFGSLFLIIGAIGVFIPILPTTPFLLLAAACYLRGSERLYRWMLSNRIFGAFIRNYLEGRGIRFTQKIFTLMILWVMIFFSIFYVVESFLLRTLVFLIAMGVSVHIVMLPTLRQTKLG